MGRGALALLALIWAHGLWAQPTLQIEDAQYADPTRIYPHAVLGDDVEHLTLKLTLSNGVAAKVTWPADVVFEDTSPRLRDLNGDGAPEVIVVESHRQRGARLAVYGLVDGVISLRAASPFIGQRFRWLAPVGAADLDGDGAFEIAWVDRPHLARTLRIWRYSEQGGQVTFREVTQLKGVTNHRIGEQDIAGGIRTCDGRPEMIVASADWSRLLSVRLTADIAKAKDIGPHKDRSSFEAALTCR